MKRDLCCCLCGGFGLSLFFVAPFSLLAVFYGASVFNQDVSKWNTGAVTNMNGSKCNLSLSLSVATAPPLSQVSHVLFIFCCLWFETGHCCCCLCGGFGPSFLCCTLLLSCSVCLRICVQFRRVEMEYECGDKYVKQ